MFSIYASIVLLAAIITACPELLDQRYGRVEAAMQVLCQNSRLQEDLREAIGKQDFTNVLNIGSILPPLSAASRHAHHHVQQRCLPAPSPVIVVTQNLKEDGLGTRGDLWFGSTGQSLGHARPSIGTSKRSINPRPTKILTKTRTAK
ncbi:hypothetical protein CY34DRAFT_813911 [Suillus luteus UH-Slu-Lm8-n1]|uniref:Secreted protein n=1 Tax=Suillus luteus UH-Slu-Lm8-n1 TaxID=930992 RepID=A0A0D0AFP0_9AGAM|nr:hypothetical protein CY34DRAFT_813911 [Suillus luteus UH-Slu-Lm8-n1]